jgi:hypothetical protein
MSDDEFLAAFEACAVARAEWTHEAHVRMAWLYVVRTGPGALDRVRAGIQKLSAAFVLRQQMSCIARSRKEPDPRGLGGYHGTITTAFVALIAARVAPGDDFAAFRARNPDLFDRAFPALLKHYSPQLLYSERAKAAFIEPDLEPLP